MLIIAHRANIGGPDHDLENSPDQVDRCISGYTFNVEVDLWRTHGGELFLGHDEPTHRIDIQWLYMRSNFLWIHCKNVEALCFLQNHPFSTEFRYFWHENDDYTLTSNGFVWAYPGKEMPKPARAVCVMPEWNVHNSETMRNFYAVCTDYPEKFIEHR